VFIFEVGASACRRFTVFNSFPLFRFFFVKVRPALVRYLLLSHRVAPFDWPARAAASGEGEPPGALLGTPANILLSIEQKEQPPPPPAIARAFGSTAACPRPCCCYTFSAAVSFARVA